MKKFAKKKLLNAHMARVRKNLDKRKRQIYYEGESADEYEEVKQDGIDDEFFISKAELGYKRHKLDE